MCQTVGVRMAHRVEQQEMFRLVVRMISSYQQKKLL